MLSLSQFIRDYKTVIVEEWIAATAHLPSVRDLSAPAIRDHIPELLDSLADAIDRNDLSAVPLQGIPNVHAALRAREGYDLRQVVVEYRTLRRVIHELYSEHGDISEESRPKMRPLRAMHVALDGAIADAVDQFSIERDRARELFISMLGHDLRDPLQAIAFGAALLQQQQDTLPPATLKTVDRIAATTRRMTGMIADLLDFAHTRLGSGLPVVLVPLDIRPVIADAVHELADAHPQRDVRSEVEHAPGRFDVHWDGDRIAQAVSNLVGNALAHGQDPIVIALEDRGDRIVIEVSNAGTLPPALMPKLFEGFTWGDSDRRTDGDGYAGPDRRRGHLGLGLYIVSEIARAHGGSVAADSSGGVTRFRLDLPRAGA